MSKQNSICIIANAISFKNLHNPNQSNHALMIELKIFVSWSLTIYDIFSNFNPSTGPIHTDVTILLLARLDALISTIVQNLNTENVRGYSRQKQFRDVFSKLLQFPTSHIIGTVCRFVDYWNPKNLVFKT